MSARTRYCSRCLTTFTEDVDQCPNLACRLMQPKTGWGELLENGDVLDRHYYIERRLAIGGAGVTYLAKELGPDDTPTGPYLAVKVLYVHRDAGTYLKRLATEANILLELDHPHIVRIMGFVQRSGHSPYLVTRFEEGGSLLDHLRRVGAMGVPEVAAMGMQLCEALSKAHARGVVHRDMKPENVLLSGVVDIGETPETRLTDFGIAKVTGGPGASLTRVGAFVGTPQYAAPEQFFGEPPTAAADVYAMAAVLLFCLTLRPLMPDLDMAAPEDTAERLVSLLPPRLGREAGDTAFVEGFNTFLAATMDADPRRRADIDQARQMLEALSKGLPVEAPRPVMPAGSLSFPDPSPGDAVMDPHDTFKGILSHAEPGGISAGTAAYPPLGNDDPALLEATVNRTLDETTSITGPATPGQPLEPAQSLLGGVDPLLDDDFPPRKKSRAGCVMGLLVLGLIGAAPVAWLGWTWSSAPSTLPSFVKERLPTPIALDPTKAEHAEDVAAINGSWDQHAPQLRTDCPGSGQVQLVAIVERTGWVRKVQVTPMGDNLEAAKCLGRAAQNLRFDRSGDQPVKVGWTMSLEG